jgi:hypothetical protein
MCCTRAVNAVRMLSPVLALQRKAAVRPCFCALSCTERSLSTASGESALVASSMTGKRRGDGEEAEEAAGDGVVGAVRSASHLLISRKERRSVVSTTMQAASTSADREHSTCAVRRVWWDG